MKKLEILTLQQSVLDIFIAEQDAIYYPGYTQELIDTEPEKFQWELAEYKSQFAKEFAC